MTEEEFWKYIHKPNIVRQDYIVAIRTRYSEHDKWEYTNELLTLNEDDPFYFIWDNDWWEGKKFVEILGYISISDISVPHNLQERSPCIAKGCSDPSSCCGCNEYFEWKQKQNTRYKEGISPENTYINYIKKE